MGKNLLKMYSFRCDDTLIQKIEYIAKLDKRTRNNLMVKILQEYVNDYEAENGTIELPELPPQDADQPKR